MCVFIFLSQFCFGQLKLCKPSDIDLSYVYKTGHLLDLSKLMNENDSIDFDLSFHDKNIKPQTVFFKINTDSYNVLVVKMTGAPAVMQQSFIFINNNKTKTLAYSNSDKILIDKNNKAPFILITSLKGKFYAQRANVLGKNVTNNTKQIFWENYKINDCDLLSSDGVKLVNRSNKAFLRLLIKDDCHKTNKIIEKEIR